MTKIPTPTLEEFEERFPELSQQNDWQVFYDRDGNQITFAHWMWLVTFHSDYKVVRQDKVGDMLVSTVWLGLDHGLFNVGAPPVIFETAFFTEGPRGEDLQTVTKRYHTEEEAVAGHLVALSWAKDVYAPGGST